MSISENGVINIIKKALAILYLSDRELIFKKAHEQAIAARLLCYLQNLLPEWDIDVEYNRQGEGIIPKTDMRGVKRKPDIIIHKRGPAGPNLAVILVKCEWNRESREIEKNIILSIKKKYDYKTAFLLEIKSSDYELSSV